MCGMKKKNETECSNESDCVDDGEKCSMRVHSEQAD